MSVGLPARETMFAARTHGAATQAAASFRKWRRVGTTEVETGNRRAGIGKPMADGRRRMADGGRQTDQSIKPEAGVWVRPLPAAIRPAPSVVRPPARFPSLKNFENPLGPFIHR